MKIATVIGARPQFIKAATVSRAIAHHNEQAPPADRIEEAILHTGQHYDDNMSGVFFDELQIPQPRCNLGIGSGPHGEQTGKMLSRIEKTLLEEKPDLVVTYGDTNSTLAGALAAAKLQILTAHVEAGLRSFNRRMPEEINRVLADALSNVLFCPTETAVANLKREGIGAVPQQKRPLDLNERLVLNTGDVMYDSLLFNMALAREQSVILQRLGLARGVGRRAASEAVCDYCLATVHRAENTDDRRKLAGILEGLKRVAAYGVPVILPVHPRTRKCIEKAGLAASAGLTGSLRADGGTSAADGRLVFIEPLSYLDMIQLANHAAAVFTDSGGLQKEAFLLEVPCITLRNETEWVETVREGGNVLSGADPERIARAFERRARTERGRRPPAAEGSEPTGADPGGRAAVRPTPYGDGKAAEKIVEAILRL